MHSLPLSLSRFTFLSCRDATHTQSTLQGSRTLSCPRTRMTWRTIHVAYSSRERSHVRTCVHTCVRSRPSPLPSATEKLHTAPLHGRPWGQRPLSAWYRRAGSPRSDSSRDPGESRKEPRDSLPALPLTDRCARIEINCFVAQRLCVETLRII